MTQKESQETVTSRPFKRVLVANRGEIAVRIGRTCRDMGMEVVAVFSAADRHALHVRFAHDAIDIGDSPPLASYLRADRIVEAAQRSGAEAIHPGYGFLAENADFARAVTAAGLIFVGPPPNVMELMGDKLQARQAMLDAGVPVVPGTVDPLADADEACKVAAEVGYPVMLKAAAGGGGKGIRIVTDPEHMASAFRTASGEARSAFGDGRMYVEKFLRHPRHIEVQILADHHGNVVHLGERECSIQRRHQKLIEEAPASRLPVDIRNRICETAVQAAKAVQYRSAGTVEFLYSEGEFYFLEMNTRIQVEHGITEEIYGVDLIEQMLRVAAGEELELTSDLQSRGHAIEVRLNAEDPDRQFAPSIGIIRNLRFPGGPGLRMDSALYRGMEVTPFYDSMLGKLMTWGADREQARRRMLRVLQELHVGGVQTSAGIALRVLQSEEFQAGGYDTGFLEELLQRPRTDSPDAPVDLAQVAMVAAALHRQHSAQRESMKSAPASAGSGQNPWVAVERAGRAARRFPRP